MQGEEAACSPALPSPVLPCPALPFLALPKGVQVPVWLMKGSWGCRRMALTAQPRVSCLFPHIHKCTPHHTEEDLIGISEGKLLMLNLSGEVISESLLSKLKKASGVNN